MGRNGHSHDNWTILWVVTLIYFFITAPSSHGMNIVSTHMALERKLNLEIIGQAGSAFYIAIAIFAIPTSCIILKRGFRFVIGTGCLLAAAAYVLLHVLADHPHFEWIYIAIYLPLGAAAAFSGVITGPSIINQYFQKKKALAMSVFVSSMAVGGLVIPVLTEKVSEWFGWRCNWGIFFVFSIIAFVLAILFIKEKRYTVTPEADELPSAASLAACKATEEMYVGQAPPLGKRALLSLKFIAYTFISTSKHAIFTGVTSYFLVYAMEKGLTSLDAAALLSCYNIISLLGRLVVGAQESLRISSRTFSVACYLMLAIGAGALAAADSFLLLAVAVILLGFGHGVLSTLLPLLAGSYFTGAEYSMVYSAANTIGFLGCAAFPIIIFQMVEYFGGYQYPYLFLMLLAVISTGLSIIISGRKRATHIY